jgi:uncharacterized cofD-like protein
MRPLGAGPRVVAVGGGHGLAATLAAVRRYAGDVTAVVSVADDGGSSGRVRRSVDMPAPGDLRRCLVALAEPGSLWARVFDHRFAKGDLEGHALGNLIIAGLTEETGDFGRALEEAARLLGVQDRVLPVVTTPVALRAWSGGREVVGEVEVGEATGPISSVAVRGLAGEPTRAADAVLDAVAAADQVVIGPGSLYTSVLAACVVPGLVDALNARAGGRVFVANLAPEASETRGMTLADQLQAVAAHGITVDHVVYDPAAFEGASGPGGCGPLEPAARALAGTVGAQPVARRAPATRLVAAAVAAAGGTVHHPERLGAVLAGLVPASARPA